MPHLVWLADAFRAIGITVAEEPDWRTRGNRWRGKEGLPDGGVQHHTAPPVPFPVKKLYEPKIKCNWNVKQDGTLHLVAAGACNFSTGEGSGTVHEEVKQEMVPTGTAASRQLMDTKGGNSFFLNNETDHPGDGSPIPSPQYRTVVLAWVAVCDRLGWSPARVIAHGEWTRRKIDPAWNGKTSHENMQQIRADIGAALQGAGDGIEMREVRFTEGLPVGHVRARLTAAGVAAAYNNGIIRGQDGQAFKPGSSGAIAGIKYWTDPARPDEEWRSDFWPAFDNGIAVRMGELQGGS